ncbi:hypothetical protein SCA6_002130 [Theobroma cacao]
MVAIVAYGAAQYSSVVSEASRSDVGHDDREVVRASSFPVISDLDVEKLVATENERSESLVSIQSVYMSLEDYREQGSLWGRQGESVVLGSDNSWQHMEYIGNAVVDVGKDSDPFLTRKDEKE